MSEKQKEFTIALNSLDLGQLLDGLRIRAKSWRTTADFIEAGYAADDAFVCEECNNAHEATKIAEHYERIVASIEHQIDKQGGW